MRLHSLSRVVAPYGVFESARSRRAAKYKATSFPGEEARNVLTLNILGAQTGTARTLRGRARAGSAGIFNNILKDHTRRGRLGIAETRTAQKRRCRAIETEKSSRIATHRARFNLERNIRPAAG